MEKLDFGDSVMAHRRYIYDARGNKLSLFEPAVIICGDQERERYMVCFADGEKKRLAREFITKPESVAVELGDITVKNHASHRFVQIPGQRLEIALEAMSMLLQPGASLAGDVWAAVVKAGAKPCGLGARDTLRLRTITQRGIIKRHIIAG